MELFAGRPQTPIPPPPRPEDVESIVPNLPLPPAPGAGRDKLPFLADDYDESGDIDGLPASLELNDGSVADVQSLRNLFLQYLNNSPPRPESLPQTQQGRAGEARHHDLPKVARALVRPRGRTPCALLDAQFCLS